MKKGTKKGTKKGVIGGYAAPSKTKAGLTGGKKK